MPTIAMGLSLLGLVPFILGGLAAVGNIPQTAQMALIALVDYAALVLAFAGGVHWGLTLPSGSVRPSLRIALGAVPLIVAWLALVVAQIVAPSVALPVLILGYLASASAEHRGSRRMLVPPSYVWLRWGFTAVAVLMMLIVLILKGLGETIVF